MKSKLMSLEAAAALIPSGSSLTLSGPILPLQPMAFIHALVRRRVRDLTMMVQREVARRLAAVPRTKAYGILSVFCQLFADVEVLFDVQPGSFHPRPDVTSSVVRLVMLDAPRYALRDEQFFRGMVRSVFGKRRKTLRNALRYFIDIDPAAAVPDVSILQCRPEDLTLEETVELSNVLFEHVHHDTHSRSSGV